MNPNASPMQIILAALLYVMGVNQASSNNPTVKYGADYIKSVMPTVFDGDIRNLPRARSWQPGDPIKEIPKRRKPPERPVKQKSIAKRVDPLLSIQRNASADPKDRVFSQTIIDRNGQGFTGVNPPDTNGDVGMNYYVQMINSGGGSTFVVYNKSDGTIAGGPVALDSLGSGNCANGLGDPIVLYDSLADRWLLSEFSATANALCVYISQTSSPLGGYFAYQFVTPNFPDYPKYSVWPSGYFVTSNEGGAGPAIYALDRVSMLSGSPASLQRYQATPNLGGFGFEAVTPADFDGSLPPPANSPAYFMRHRDDEAHNSPSDNSKDFLDLWKLAVDFSNSGNSSLTGPVSVEISEFDSDLCGLSTFSCLPQPQSGTMLDPLREVIMWRLQYLNNGSHETLVGNFVTDVSGTDRAGIRWFELRKTTGEWFLHQEGTYSPDSTNRWMGAISMDRDGNMAVGYNVADGSSTYPGLRYAGRRFNDPLGSLPQGEVTIIDGSAANASIRYGDYSSLSVDPSDHCTFWFTGEYNPLASWNTRIASFKFDSCGDTPEVDTDSEACYVLKNAQGQAFTICL